MPLAVQVSGTNINRWLKDVVSQEINHLKDDYKASVVPRTPIDTGKARRGWQTRQNRIENRVPYIARLEGGYSRQAPRGFVNQALSSTIEKSDKRKY
jgi:hypothetical protein